MEKLASVQYLENQIILS